MATNIETSLHEEGEARILKVNGEVDMDSSPDVKDAIQKSLRGAKTLKVDLSSVDYIDSSGIAVLIQGMKDSKRAKVDFRLLNPSTNVRQVIELAMLQQVFTIEDSETAG